MTTTTPIRRRGRGLHPRREPVQQFTGVKGRGLPEYLDANEVNAVLAAAPNPRAKLLILLQWRAGLRVSEALALEPGDLSLDADRPTLRVRSGKGGKAPRGSYPPRIANGTDRGPQLCRRGTR